VLAARRKKESAAFLKKRSKKLLLKWTVLVKRPLAQSNESFLRAFFQKSAAYLLSQNGLRGRAADQ
jgi:hypothetical protein